MHELQVACVTEQGIPVGIRGVVIFKVGDDYTSIANSARRFLDQEDQMETRVHNVFAGHLRSIVGGLTVEEVIRDRARLTSETRESSATEMQKLGLIIDSLQIHEIDDPTGYIENLAKPHAAAVASQARIAQADADREATQREQEAEALKAEARRDAQIKQAAYQADVDKATAEAKQAGPLAAGADAEKVRVTAAAEAEAERRSVTASAEAGAAEKVGYAEANATKARGLAEGEAIEAKGLAEAKAIDARAKALAENQEAVIGQQLAENYPQIVAAAAEAFHGINNMTVLNGADGVTEALSTLIGNAGAGIATVRQLLASQGQTNGHNGADTEAASAAPPSVGRGSKT